MSDRTSAVAVVQKRASAALGEIRRAVGDLATTLSPGRVVDDDVLMPVRRLVQGVASVAELAVDPLVQLIDIQRKFVESQRALADQMAAWAELQHQLADRIAAWADVQRQIANAMDRSLAPVAGVAHMTTRLLEDVAGKPPATTERPARKAATKARPARKSTARSRSS